VTQLREALISALGNDFRGEVLAGEPLSSHSYLGIGGPADLFVVPSDALSLKQCLAFAAEVGLPLFVLGGGSNVLIPDEGFRGMVVSLSRFSMKKVISEKKDAVELFVEAGVRLGSLISMCAERGYTGLESLSGIPGMVGGAVACNAGAYGQEVGSSVSSLVVLSLAGAIRKVERGQVSFAYRSCSVTEGQIILSAVMSLGKNNAAEVARRAAESLAQKRATQPLGQRSAGCAFKNPPGDYAGRLIEAAGCKGLRVGGIEVSNTHANFLVNSGGGTAADYLELMNTVRERVARLSGIDLETEIRILRNEPRA